jgi:hypothetical protein
VDQFGAAPTGDAGLPDAGLDASGTTLVPPGDVWVARLTRDRLERWQLALGTAGSFETAESAVELSDMRIAIAGSTFGVTDADAWLVLLEPRGVVSVEKRLGGPGDQRFVDVVALTNGDIVTVGLSTDATGTQGILAARFTPAGALVWQRIAQMPGATGVRAVQVLKRADDRLVFVGAVDGPDDDRGLDLWIGATDLDGTLEWQRMLGTTADDEPAHAAFTEDFGLVIASRVVPTEPPSDPAAPVAGDAWVLKVDRGGSVVFQRYFERLGYDERPQRVVVRRDGRVNVVATADGFGSRNLGDDDVWILELTADGTPNAQRVIASLSPDRPVGVYEEDADTLTITGVVDERPTYWSLDDDGTLVDGCGVVTDTDARIIDTSIQVTDGFATWIPAALSMTDATSTEARPPPLTPLECRLARP